jgi:hypothetical protein
VPSSNPPSHTAAIGKLTLAVIAMVLAVAVLAGPAAAKKPRAKPLYWGALIGTQLTGTAAPWDMHAAAKFERSVGKGLSIIQFSAPFANCYASPCAPYSFATGAMQTIRDHGAIPFFNWASQSIPATLEQPDFRLATLNAGAHDTYIREFAEAAREWGHPFFLRFNWEMNGFWFPWSEGVNGNQSGEFVAAWRHVHDIFTSVGATNATWVWCPNIDYTHNLRPMRPLYPGGKYVDWTCIDGFNWGETSKSAGWMNFNSVFRDTYRRILRIAPNKPMVIGETASEERGGSKAHWIRNMLRIIPRHFRKVRALIWFDEADQGMNWPIESSRAATRAFRRGIRAPVYRSNLYARLASGPIRPPTWGPPPMEPLPPPEEPAAPVEPAPPSEAVPTVVP